MADLTRRIHILLSDEQYDFLRDLSEREGRPVGDLVRTAFESVYRPSTPIVPLRALEVLNASPLIRSELIPAGTKIGTASPLDGKGHRAFLGSTCLLLLAAAGAVGVHLRTLVGSFLRQGGEIGTSTSALERALKLLTPPGDTSARGAKEFLRVVRPCLSYVHPFSENDIDDAMELVDLCAIPVDVAWEIVPAVRQKDRYLVHPEKRLDRAMGMTERVEWIRQDGGDDGTSR